MKQDDPAFERGEMLKQDSASLPSILSERFDTKEVALVTGVDVGKLQNWLTRGLIKLKSELNPGRGQSRQYSPYEVGRIRLMKRLANVGVPLSTAFGLTEALKRTWEQVPGGHEAYGREPNLQSWLLVLPATEWPVRLKASMVRVDNYVAVWLIDRRHGQDHSTGLRATLAAMGDAAVVLINIGVFLDETLSRLTRLAEAR